MNDQPIPLSHLELELGAAPLDNWDGYLSGLGIAMVLDDIGRKAIARPDARRLLSECEAAEVRRREVAARNDAEAERQRLASVWRGIPADQVPAGLTPAMAMMPAEYENRPRRSSVLEDALSDEGTVFHRYGPTPEGGE